MTIHRVNDDTTITIGQWVHGTSSLEYGLYSEPRQVTDIRGKRIHYRRQDGSESFMLRAQVLIVCDTEASANLVYALSVQRNHDISSQVSNIVENYAHQYEVRLSALLGAA